MGKKEMFAQGWGGETKRHVVTIGLWMGPFPEYATLARPPIYTPFTPWNEALRICMESAGGSFGAGGRTLCVLSLSLSGGGDGLGLSEVMIANIPAISAAEIVATRPIQAAFVEEFFPIVEVESA